MSIQIPSNPSRLVSSNSDGSIRWSVVRRTGSFLLSFALILLGRMRPPSALTPGRIDLVDQALHVRVGPGLVGRPQRSAGHPDVDAVLADQARAQERPKTPGGQDLVDRGLQAEHEGPPQLDV